MTALAMTDVERLEQIQRFTTRSTGSREKYPAAVDLCYFEGRTHAEAANLLKCPVGTISVRLLSSP